MSPLLTLLHKLPAFTSLLASIESGDTPIAVSGLAAIHRAHFAAGLSSQTKRPLILLCADASEADRLTQDLTAFTQIPVLSLPPREFTFHPAAAVSHQWEHRRLSVFHAMAQGEAPLVVTTMEALLQRTIPKDILAKSSHTFNLGESHSLSQITQSLVSSGYTHGEQVEGVGQFSQRGGILDFFSPAYPQPVRMEFFGDEIDSIGLFDVDTQRRTQTLKQAQLLPTSEVLPQHTPEGLPGLLDAIDKLQASVPDPTQLREDRERFEQGTSFPAIDRYLALIYPQLVTAVHHFPSDALILFLETPRVIENGKNYLWQLNQDIEGFLDTNTLVGSLAHLAQTEPDFYHSLAPFPLCFLDTFPSGHYPIKPKVLLDVLAKQLPAFGGNLEIISSDVSHYQKSDFGCFVLAASEQRCLNLQALLREQKLRTSVDFTLQAFPEKGKTTLCLGGLSAGLEYPDAHLAILAEGNPLYTKKKKKFTNRNKLSSFADLSSGDYVVHEHHGIGRYVGMEKIETDGIVKDYVKLAYAGTDILYLPATQLDSINKYIGSGADIAHKKLSKLGGTDWEKAKTRTRKAVKDLAKGLIQLYAQRQRQPGYAFSADSPWMAEFESQFEFVETDDQLKAIADIKEDMEMPRPMDRLLCGDVGYGKTEVAFRAMMKSILDGKQTAILVPTTVLARQHFLSASRRFRSFPVNIEVISRFRTKAQMTQIIQKLQDGQIDLLIGTHRLLQKDIKFKDLGLLVVDEEQRFGVTHKERLKEFSKQVDVLTLSATPIPRTLNMALSGIRDMSTLEEPPHNRQPVQTYVLEHDWGHLVTAMTRELERGGQIYYLHNKVDTIDHTVSRIQALLPQARIGVGHGKMTQDALSKVMGLMTDGEIDILVCTTIIETGIDISNVNTLIIEDADHLGLAQLHQIRGRVGRSARRASAYLTFRKGKILSEIATKRLSAIREFAEFGSGFKIAMRDLEIRGAGNVLGPEQSGFLLSVGYDMYLKLLDEAVLEERGETPKPLPQCTADLTVSASIPESYIPSPEQRMSLYRRIAGIRSEEEADDVVDELIDRYGDPPKSVNHLVSIALLRSSAAELGIIEISQKGQRLNFYLRQVDFGQVSSLCGGGTYQGKLLFSAGEKPHLSLKLPPKCNTVLTIASQFIRDFSALSSTDNLL